MPSRTVIIGTGLTSMVGSRFVDLFHREFDFINLDLATGVNITQEKPVKEKIGESSGGVVIHFAALTDVNEANEQSGDKNGLCYQVNVLGTRYVAQSCKATGKYLIHISTDFVFDGEKGQPYTEEDSPNPIEWYGQTKLWAEQEVQQAGGDHAILRIAYPYRAIFPLKPDLVRSIIKKFEDDNLHPLFTDHIITPTFVDDIAQVLKTFVAQRPKGIFHATGSSSLSDYDLGVAIAKVFDFDASRMRKGSLAEFLKTAKRPYQKNLTTSNAKLNQELGITMSTLEQGLKTIKKQIEDA